ncbi:uncharacterized protein LOC134249562 [Saccostrea cucullata]|uniref:uncharacterized protein LOC134249562 n=1 Tax=Saccostrea cuccullata TaxID=36930 RepID=UPI002ED21930
MEQLPTFKNTDTTTEAEKSVQSSLLDRLGSDFMFSSDQKSECINVILNCKTKGDFIDYLFRDAEFKSEFSRKLSKEIELNASTKCIRNSDSYLFSKNYDDLKQFSFQNVMQEMSQCQPDLLKFLLAVAVPSNRIGKPVSSLLPKLGLIYSILMSSRFHELSRLQRVVSTVLMEEQVHEKVFDRLQKLGVSTSPDVCSRLLDDFGGHFNNEVIALLHAGKSFRFIGDNVNFTVGVKSERQDSKPQVCNWFASCLITQTLTFPDLLDIPQGRTRDLDVSHFLPTANDERKLKDDYKVLISRIAKTFLPHLTFLYEGQPKHILGQYSHYYKQKNVVMPSKVLPLNEQNYADCVKILSEYEDTLENIFRQAGIDLDHARPIHIGGDQLTRERFSGAKSLKSGCFSAKERFDHLSPITFELWHTAMNFLKLIFAQLYNKCGSDKGTIEGERVLRQRDNVKEDVKNNYDQDKDFFLSFLKAYVVEALCSFFGMNTKLDNPTKHIFPPDLSKAERKNWVEKTLDEFLDQYVFAQKSDASLSQMHEIEERRAVPLNVTLPGGGQIL